jgi:hypothetical protein
MKTLLLALLFASANFTNAQVENVPTTQINIKTTHPTDWVTYAETSSFRIEYVFVDCDPNSGLDYEAVFLRVTNLTGTPIVLSWHADLFYDEDCKTCGKDEYDRSISLGANEMKEAGCEIESIQKLRIFSKFTDAVYSKGAQLTAFQLSNLQKQ